ncbi:MAG: hypothetical protein ACOC44_10420 [Promethearchaeia archaeon]
MDIFSICGECFSTQKSRARTLAPTHDYNIKRCRVCGEYVNRHTNAARVSAQLLKQTHHSTAT